MQPSRSSRRQQGLSPLINVNDAPTYSTSDPTLNLSTGTLPTHVSHMQEPNVPTDVNSTNSNNRSNAIPNVNQNANIPTYIQPATAPDNIANHFAMSSFHHTNNQPQIANEFAYHGRLPSIQTVNSNGSTLYQTAEPLDHRSQPSVIFDPLRGQPTPSTNDHLMSPPATPIIIENQRQYDNFSSMVSINSSIPTSQSSRNQQQSTPPIMNLVIPTNTTHINQSDQLYQNPMHSQPTNLSNEYIQNNQPDRMTADNNYMQFLIQKNKSMEAQLLQMNQQIQQVLQQNNMLMAHVLANNENTHHRQQSNSNLSPVVPHPATPQPNVYPVDHLSHQSQQPIPNQNPAHHPLLHPPTSTTTNPIPITQEQQTMQNMLTTMVNALNHTKDSYTSTKFPKLSGKSKNEFRLWYDQVLSILASPGWSKLFDITNQSPVPEDNADPALSAKLYMSLKLCLNGDAQKIMLKKKGLNGKGLIFLQTLKNAYDTSLSPVEVEEKHKEFLNLYRLKDESIDVYAARLMDLRMDLEDNGLIISDPNLKHRFIMGLGPIFTTIQQNLTTNNLPPQWQTNDYEALIRIASSWLQSIASIRKQNEAYRQLIKPKSEPQDNKPNKNQPKGATPPVQKPKSSNNATNQDGTPLTESQIALRAHYAQLDKDRQSRIIEDIKKGTFQVSKYESEVRPGTCVFHGTRHSSDTCTLLQTLREQLPTNTPSRPRAMANKTQINQEQLEQTDQNQKDMQELQDATDQLLNFTNVLNNSNKDNIDSYLKITCRHVKYQQDNSHPESKIKFVLDSGAYPHMVNTKSLFIKYSPWKQHNAPAFVTFADGTTKAKIHGIGSIYIKLNGKKVIMNGVLHVPTLSDNLFSVKHHCELPGTYVHVKGQNATIAFPAFIHDTPITNEIFIHATKPTKNEKEQQINKKSNPENELETKAISRISKTKPDPQTQNLKTTVEIVKISTTAKTPTKSTEGAAGYDIYAAAPVCIPPNCRTKVKTHIAMAIPKGLYGRIAPRSGMSIKHKIDIAAGVIDGDYRGEIFPCLINNSNEDFNIKTGDRIAQIIFERIGDTNLKEVTNLNTTIRNKGGFGHTDEIPQPSPLSKLIPKLKLDQKITIKLPNKDKFEKGTLTPSEDHYLFKNDSTQIKLNDPELLDLYTSNNLLFGHSHLITKSNQSRPQSKSPPLRTVDKPLATSDTSTSYTIDQLKRNFGFRNIQSILNEMKTTIDNLHVSTSDKEPITDLGEVTTINKPKRNTNPLNLPEKFGDLIHMDILFGSGTSIGGYRYALFLVDRATRSKFVYPIRSLKNDILNTIKTFCSDIQMVPKAFKTDFDHKIMGKQVQYFIKSNNGTIESVPPNEQNKNGLCERNWRSVLVMSRNWLASALLPCQFWWHALKRSTEIANYFPIKVDNKLTSPHELTYGTKPDMRSIIPIFSVAYVNYKHPKTFQTQTIRTITIGRSNTTNTPEFYHPSTKQIITSNAYKIDETLTPGPAFNLPYDGGFYFNKYSQGNDHNRPPIFTPNQIVYIKSSNEYIPTKIITIPMLDDQIYTVSYPDGSIHQHEASDILPNDPDANIENSTETTLPTLPKWFHHLSKCTLFLNNMQRPKHGYLIKVDSEWKFRPGSKITNIPIHLPDLEANLISMIQSHQIFSGHPHFARIHQMKNNYLLTSGIAKHVSAANLTSQDVPTLIQHKLLCQTDKQIWDNAYAEEYFGLQNLPAWTTITQAQFDSLDSKRKYALPTMAISTIKYDEHNRPKRAKYRIVALGNLDPNNWSKSDCYAPVMSLLELRLMTVLAVKKKRYLKCGDVKQAFCQAILPPNEQYVLKPPPGCPLTPPNSYWMLKRTLYGLKRSPRHWYEKAVSFLNTIGLHQCKHAPCLFTGYLIKGHPPIYLGLYVDDFVYFSESDEVEKLFEEKLAKLTQVDFMGQVSHFLGIRFQWRQSNSEIQVHLSQQAFTENLINQAGLDNPAVTTNLTPYRSGYPIDSIKPIKTNKNEKAQLEQELRSYVGSFLWLSQGTRPDIATITNILSKHQNNPAPAHISAAKYVIKYLKGTKDFGITFSSNSDTNISTFVHFPIKSKILTGITDANWGPQDQSKPIPGKIYPKVDIFKSRSISGHLITLHGPLHWSSKRQKVTARSSAEAEIYATDHCVRDILYLRNIMTDLNLLQETFPNKTPIYNDNMACVMWSQSKTNKRMRHMQIPENGVRENIKILDIKHIEGKINPSDIFTKEDKDVKHFQSLRNSLVQPPMKTSDHKINYPMIQTKPLNQNIDIRTSE